jgi:hypothetical protein
MVIQRAGLCALDAVHRSTIYELLRHPNHRGTFRGVSPLTSAAMLEQILTSNVLCSALVVDLSAPQESIVGLAQCIGADFLHGTVQLAVVLHPDRVNQVWPLLGVLRFLDAVFKHYPIRKIYLEVPETNLDQMRHGITRFFRREGTLESHEWSNGSFVDVTFFSISRLDFLDHPWRQRALQMDPSLTVGFGSLSDFHLTFK